MDDLADDDIVVRFGRMLISDLDRSVERAAKLLEARGQRVEYSLSARALPGHTADELMALARLPHVEVRLSSVERVRRAGWEILLTDETTGHVSLHLAAGITVQPDAVSLFALQNTFDPPIPNMYRQLKGSTS